MTSGCYVYAIVPRDSQLPPDLTGLHGGALSTVPSDDLTAVVSYLDSPKLRPTAEHVLCHENVVEALRLSGPALPVCFGTVMHDADAVGRAVAERYSTLLTDLVRLGDKIELGLTVLWPEPEQSDDGSRGVPSGSHDTAPAMGPGTRYLRARQAEHLREQALRSRAGALARELDGLLGRCALDGRSTSLPAAGLALRRAYLLEPCQLEAFRRTFEEARRGRPDLRFLLSGPWPPYSFVTAPDAVPQLPVSGDPGSARRAIRPFWSDDGDANESVGSEMNRFKKWGQLI